MRQIWTIAITTALVLLAVGCNSSTDANRAQGGTGAGSNSQPDLPQGSEPVKLDPADFSTNVDNPYWPMSPGDKWVYREIESGKPELRVEVIVTDRTKQIANGVEARVVHDVVTEDGQPIEITDDWYAQDKAGNIWYLGEDTAEYEDGKITTRSGSFEAGVDGAQAGIIMPADPRDGMAYRQEYYKGEAEDRAEVLSTDEQVEVPFGYFKGALMTKDLVPLEPKVSEYKLYARDVGPRASRGDLRRQRPRGAGQLHSRRLAGDQHFSFDEQGVVFSSPPTSYPRFLVAWLSGNLILYPAFIA
jgi:hypothetical protein